MTPLVHERNERRKRADRLWTSRPLRPKSGVETTPPPDRGQPTWMGNLAARARIRSPSVDGAEASGGVVKAQPRPTEKKAREPRGRPSPVPRLSVLFCIHSGRPSPRNISVIKLLVRAGF
ncbi:hypothetical protein QR685DRAFT_574069 [Neurospora intermedia]|uniref:Uncharacterized protein n=1 Tax=Neurospora intermedia TaxID=5142 RepID=A0ABR3D5F5_NEUIN